MKTLIRSTIFAIALGFSVWTLAVVSFTDVSSNFSAGNEVSATAFNDLFAAINANFSTAKAAIDANEAAIANLAASSVAAPAVSAGTFTNQTVPNNSVRKIVWDGESFDIGGFHDNANNNTRLTIPEAGIYQVNALVAWSSNPTGDRILTVIKNGTVTQLTDVKTATGSLTSQSLNGLLSLEEGDFLETTVFQTSGTDLTTVSTSPMQFSVVKVSELP